VATPRAHRTSKITQIVQSISNTPSVHIRARSGPNRSALRPLSPAIARLRGMRQLLHFRGESCTCLDDGFSPPTFSGLRGEGQERFGGRIDVEESGTSRAVKSLAAEISCGVTRLALCHQDVKIIQQSLRDKGFDHGRAGGKVGRGVKRAMIMESGCSDREKKPQPEDVGLESGTANPRCRCHLDAPFGKTRCVGRRGHI
jgi:hypothetical protein